MNNLLPDTLHDPAPHVMVLTPHTSVFTMLRQSGTENVVVGLGPTKQYKQTRGPLEKIHYVKYIIFMTTHIRRLYM